MRQIIILDAKRASSPIVADAPGGAQPVEDKIAVRSLFWFPVAAGSETPITDAQARISRYTEATAPELDALKAGTIVEEEHSAFFPVDTTAAQVRQALVAAFQARATVLARPERQALSQFYGASYEDGTWTRPT